MKRSFAEGENIKLDCNSNNYNTIIDMFVKGDRLILITDKENFKLYRATVESKVKMATRCFFVVLIFQLLLHGVLAFYNLNDCEAKINYANQNMKINENNLNTKDITYICASYLMHIFLMIGYFIIAFTTTYKQSRILFQVFEIYIIIMLISDFFFSFVNP